ncbi:hypothetical protein C0Q70_07329 [Pomacea canaliculata]|uniref:G-protein coupled receptors family 1 profile domain-containing protein n=2 Tax=Pomacea canaliculata TaxID=400727 RepID=A0A2T7PEQ5_POMCA|nr:hypothetical protein C0Q70_07329 [Pomacea canaliculata]
MGYYPLLMEVIPDPNSTRLSEKDARDLLHREEDEEALELLPSLVFMGLQAIAGSMGNLLVLLVYYKRFRPSSTRTYILTMSVFDFLFNVISIPGEITDIRFTKTFNNRWLCRTFRFSNIFLTLASGFILVAVALDRRKKICLPLKHQLSPKEVKRSVFWCVSVAFVIAVPFVVLNGRHTVPTGNPYVNGSTCSVDDRYIHTPFQLIYNVILALVFFACVGTMTTAYVTIANKIVQHKRQSAVFSQSEAIGLRGRFESVAMSEASVSSSMRSHVHVDNRHEVSSGPDDEVFNRRPSVSSGYGDSHAPSHSASESHAHRPTRTSWLKFRRRHKMKTRRSSEGKATPTKAHEEEMESLADTQSESETQKLHHHYHHNNPHHEDGRLNGSVSKSPTGPAKSSQPQSDSEENQLRETRVQSLARGLSEELLCFHHSSKGLKHIERTRSSSEGDVPVGDEVSSVLQLGPFQGDESPDRTERDKKKCVERDLEENGLEMNSELRVDKSSEAGKTGRLGPRVDFVGDVGSEPGQQKSLSSVRSESPTMASSGGRAKSKSVVTVSSSPSGSMRGSGGKTDSLSRFGAFVNGSIRRLRSFGVDDNDNINGSTRSASGVRRRHTRKRIPARTTWMMFVLTAIFIISYLPYLTITCVRAVHHSIDVDLTGWRLNLYNLAHRSYFINSVTNPIVYSFCSARFRQQCRRLMSSRDVMSVSDKS